jgi:hypothetical protein
MTAAKESKTRGTIAKLDAAILDIYESYQERFENITIDDTNLTTAGITVTGIPAVDERNRALVKLHCISDIMRLEMPYQWEEIEHNATAVLHEHTIPIGNFHVLTQPPPVLEYYHNALISIAGKNNTAPQSSELLFLIIANLNPEALENFHGSEIGDIDDNGLREFHDAWGNPIQFIRWAPAFTGSDLQPDVVTASNYPLNPIGDNTLHWIDPISVTNNSTPVNTATWNNPNTLSSPYRELIVAMRNSAYPDPFDPNGVINQTWFLYPLIVSGGADGIVDLNFGTTSGALEENGSPIVNTFTNIHSVAGNTFPLDMIHPVKWALGMPCDTDGNGVLNHYDNIHNHRSGNSF